MVDQSTNRSAKILLVDDDRIVNLMMKKILDQAGFTNSTTVSSASAALKVLHERTFDLVFLDWWLPDGNGLEVLLDLRQARNTVPVIMLTAESDKEKVMLAMDAGAAEYIVKPFSIDIILSKLFQVLEKNGLSKATH